MSSPFANYDQWLDAPMERMMAESDREMEDWEAFCDSEYAANRVPYEAFEDDHPDHSVWLHWRQMMLAIQAREERLMDESIEEDEEEGVCTCRAQEHGAVHLLTCELATKADLPTHRGIE